MSSNEEEIKESCRMVHPEIPENKESLETIASINREECNPRAQENTEIEQQLAGPSADSENRING
jgi:hypothetical protein